MNSDLAKRNLRHVQLLRRGTRAGRVRLAHTVAGICFLAFASSVHANELTPADAIVTGDTADQVITKLAARPELIETRQVLGISYRLMTFRKAGWVITVRLILDHVIDVEAHQTSIFGWPH